MTTLLGRAFALWLPLAIAVSGLFVFGTWAVQQNYREGLDDPQIQTAEDAARMLAGGVAPEDVIQNGASPVDMAASLAPWLAVYDANGTPIAANGLLDGALPQLPLGVFDTRTWNRAGENRVSWQPRFAGSYDGPVREAVILVPYQTAGGASGFVAAGRNMREVERREGALQHGAALLWGATALATLLATICLLALGWL